MEEKDTPLTDNDGEQLKDNFYHGVISKIFWSNETGVIHSDSGKEVPFIFAFVTLIGAPRQDINFLRPGMRVGFDVGWTSKGLRASTIKIYDLYQDDLVLGSNEALLDPTAEHHSVADHPISRYRPQEMHETEAPRYQHRRSRPRPTAQEQTDGDARSQTQEHKRPEGPPQPVESSRVPPRPYRQDQQPRSQNRPDRRPREGEQNRADVRPQGPGQNRQDTRQDPRQDTRQGQNRQDTRQDARQGQGGRRPEPRPQGPRRNEPSRPQARPNVAQPTDGQADTTAPQADERSRRLRRRRGRR